MLSKMMRGQVRALKAILMLNTTRRSGEILSASIGRNARPQIILVLLIVVKFIFLPAECVIVSLAQLRVLRSLPFSVHVLNEFSLDFLNNLITAGDVNSGQY